MPWAAAIPAIISLVGSVAGGIGQQQQNQANQKFSLQELMQQDLDARENSEFNTEQAYYYQQLNRLAEQRGMDQFRTMSTVKNYMPNFKDTNPGVIVPDKPEFNQGKYAPPPVTPHSSHRSLFAKISDPLDLSDKSPIFDPAGLFRSH